MNFNENQAIQALESMDQESMDQLDFGVVRMDKNNKIKAYNRYELDLSGNQLKHVIEKDFFKQIAPCTNNFMVAEKYQLDQVLDEKLDYVFTYRMKPTKVVLRLLHSPNEANQYLLVKKT
jgi:photoactive yellow protein